MAEPAGTRRRAQDSADSPPAARSAHVAGGDDDHAAGSSPSGSDDDDNNKRSPPPSEPDKPLLEPTAKVAREGDPSSLWAAHLPAIADAARAVRTGGEGAGERPLCATRMCF